MKCCSRSTLGVVIGILCIVFYIVVSIYFSYVGIIMVVLVMLPLVIISGLFIIGIVKRRHKLMLPWIFISGISFIPHVTIYLAVLVRVLTQDFAGFLVLLFLGTFAIGLQALIWWVIYTLYRDIRMKSGDGNGRVIREPQ